MSLAAKHSVVKTLIDRLWWATLMWCLSLREAEVCTQQGNLRKAADLCRLVSAPLCLSSSYRILMCSWVMSVNSVRRRDGPMGGPFGIGQSLQENSKNLDTLLLIASFEPESKQYDSLKRAEEGVASTSRYLY